MTKGADTRERLLAAAALHFADKGFAATSLRDIGRELAMANASLLYHFPSKRRMYAAVLEQIAASLDEVASSLTSRGVHRDAGAVGEALMDWAQRHPAHVRIVNRELLDVASEPDRAKRAGRWYLAEPVNRLAALVGGRDRHVALMHMVGAISYFAIAAPTLAHMLERPHDKLTGAFRRFAKKQLEQRGG